jgi:hypothetical protein
VRVALFPTVILLTIRLQITHWLRDIGGINSNSYRRFMSSSGRSAGAENGLYKAA